MSSLLKRRQKTKNPESTETSESGTDEIIYGDVDMNGEVDILDVITLNKNLLGKEVIDADQQKRADVNQDTKIDSNDSLTILKFIVGMVKTLPDNS